MKRVYLYVIALLFIAGGAEASQITVQSGQSAKYTEDALGGVDALFVAPPNSAGFSVNYFDQFSVDEALKIVNTPNYNAQTGAPISSAMTVVIIANQINLSSAIDIVGPATDIVFLTNAGGGSISCSGCVVNNALRLTLASGLASNFSSTAMSIGAIATSGLVSIYDLDAPGVISLSVVAKNIVSNGSVNINSNAMSSSEGGYSDIAHGNQVVGTGSIELTIGELMWDYERSQIFNVKTSISGFTFGGSYYAPRVQISTSGDLRFTGEANTLVDVIAGISYKNQVHVPREGIVLQALSGSDHLQVDGRLVTQGAAYIRSAGASAISSYALVDAGSVEIIAEDEFINIGSVRAADIAVGAGQIANEGELISRGQIEVYAVNDLANQYGGLIQGNNIVLESQESVVRNGSRTPYRSTDGQVNNFLMLENSEILTEYLTSQDAESYLYNSSELGAFYLVPSGVSTTSTSSLDVPSKSSAHIVGNVVNIRAPAFENINPYYQFAQNQEQVVLSRERIRQVSVSAETSLFIQGPSPLNGSSSETSAGYVINSSALLSLNSPNGTFKVNSHKFINNRYRVSTFLISASSQGEVESIIEGYGLTSTWQFVPLISYNVSNYDFFSSVTAAYSPPGFLVSMGHAEFNTPDYLANVLGYIEIFNGAKVSSTMIKSFGLQNQSIETTVNSMSFRGTLNSSTEGVIHNPKDLDTLFHVVGTLEASSSSAWLETLNPFDYFVAQTAKSIQARDYSSLGKERTTYVTMDCPCAQDDWTTVTSYSNGVVQIDVDESKHFLEGGEDKLLVKFSKDVTKVVKDKNGTKVSSGSYTYTSSGTAVYSFIEELKRYAESVADKLLTLFEEFDWWGLAS